MVVFAWVDQDRRYFIATRGYIEEVESALINRWLQVAADVNSDAHMLDLYTPKTVSTELYYAIYGADNLYNKRRCDDKKVR